jgi:hypothetical protein
MIQEHSPQRSKSLKPICHNCQGRISNRAIEYKGEKYCSKECVEDFKFYRE